MSAPQSPSLALAALLLLGGVPATAQSLASEVKALANSWGRDCARLPS